MKFSQLCWLGLVSVWSCPFFPIMKLVSLKCSISGNESWRVPDEVHILGLYVKQWWIKTGITLLDLDLLFLCILRLQIYLFIYALLSSMFPVLYFGCNYLVLTLLMDCEKYNKRNIMVPHDLSLFVVTWCHKSAPGRKSAENTAFLLKDSTSLNSNVDVCFIIIPLPSIKDKQSF